MRLSIILSILVLTVQARANCKAFDAMTGIWAPASALIKACDSKWQNCEKAPLVGFSFELSKSANGYQLSTCRSDWSMIAGSRMQYRCQTGTFTVSGDDIIATDVFENGDLTHPLQKKIGTCDDTTAKFKFNNSSMSASYWKGAVAYSSQAWYLDLQDQQLKFRNEDETYKLGAEALLNRE